MYQFYSESLLCTHTGTVLLELIIQNVEIEYSKNLIAQGGNKYTDLSCPPHSFQLLNYILVLNTALFYLAYLIRNLDYFMFHLHNLFCFLFSFCLNDPF